MEKEKLAQSTFWSVCVCARASKYYYYSGLLTRLHPHGKKRGVESAVGWLDSLRSRPAIDAHQPVYIIIFLLDFPAARSCGMMMMMMIATNKLTFEPAAAAWSFSLLSISRVVVVLLL